MASRPSPSFEEPFDALIKYLQKAIKAQQTISIPDEIEKSFRAVSQPSDVSPLRKLLKLFDGKQQHHVLQLAPESFCGIVFIALHFPYIATQDKLLHTFMNALRVYRDDFATIQCLKKCGLPNIKKAQVQADRHAISQRLLHTLLRRYVGGGLEKKLRWTIAQFLATLVHHDDFARRRLASFPEIKHLSTFLQDLDDYVGRFLVSNLLRHLIYHGIDPAIFWPQGTPDQIILNFPAAEHCSVQWLAELRRFFADLDTTLALGAGRQCVLPVPELICSRGADDRADSNAVVVVSDNLTFIMASNEDVLRIRTFPVFQSSEMTVSTDSTEDTIRMSYLKDNGFQLCNGSKSAVNSISLMLENTNDAQMAQEMILKAQDEAGSLSDTKGTGDEDTAAVTPEPRRSIALVNLRSPEGQQLSTAQPTSHAEKNEGSDTQDVSPLQHRSQSLSQTHPTRPYGNQGHGGLDSETASETSFLEAAQDRQALPERLHASQSSSSNIQTASNFNARVDDAVARHRSSNLDPNAVVSESLPGVEGTTTNPPHFPRNTAEQPLKFNPAKQNLLLRSDKKRSSKQVQQSTALIGTVALSPVSPFARPPAALKSKKGSMAKLSSGPPPATSTLKKPTKTPGGAAARLAGSQHQSQKQASKSTSSTHDALKRKSLTSQKEGPSKTTDWDQDLRDDSQFDIPDDPSEEERPAKRARKGGKQPARKPAAKSSKTTISKKTQASKDTRKAPGGPKNTIAEQPPETAKQTVASTRERRPRKSAKYVEESGSENDREDQSMAEANDGSEEASSPTKDSVSQSLTAPTAPKKTGIQRRLHSQNPSIPTAKDKEEEQQSLPPPQQRQNEANQEAHRKISASYASPEDTSRKSPAKTFTPPPVVQHTKHKAVVPVAQPSEPVQRELIDDLVAEEAHDSYPMDRAGRDAAVAAARDSFGTHLQTQLANLGLPSHAYQQVKENVPPGPETPFGNKKTFIANVNAAKSTSAKKGSGSPGPKSPESHAPRTARKSATEVKDAVAVRPSSDIPGSALAAIIGKSPSSKRTSQTIEEDDGAPSADPLQDGSFVIAGDEPHCGPAALPEQHATREDRMASVSAAETSSDASRLGGTVLEPSNDDGKSAEVHSKDTNHTETADLAPTANAPRPREPSGGGALVNDTLEVPPKKRMSLAEIAKSKQGQNKRASDLGQGLKAMIDASRAGQSPTANGPAHSGARKAKATADETIVAREQKQVVRMSTALGPRELQTPRRQIEEPAGMLTSEKINKKPSIVGFGACGPQNQGVPTRPEFRRSLEVSLPPPGTEMHHEAKQQGRQDHSVDTPSHQPAPLTARSKPLPDVEENRNAEEEGVIMEDDVELESARAFGGSSHSEEAREEIQRSENPASVGQCQVERPKSITALPRGEVANDASEDESYHDASVQDLSPSSGSEEEEASEYEEEVGSVNDSAELEESRDEEERVDQGVTAKPSAPLLQDASEAPVTSTNKVIPKSGADNRESIGLGPLLKKSNPGAGDKITMKAFRSKHERAEKMRSVNDSAITNDKGRRQTTTATNHQEVDVSLMPPPKSKLCQSTGKGIERDALKPMPAGTGSPDPDANADRTANPLAQLSSIPALAGLKPTSKKREGENTGVRIATAPIRVKRHSNPDPSPEPALPIGTPVPFHAMLAETSTRAEEAGDRRKTGSYVSEDTADATLVNGNSLSTLFHHPAPRESWHERDMTGTTDESPPLSSTGDGHLAWTDEMVWGQALRPPHRSLFENVMQIANGVLFRLGDEEDAIRAKVSEYQRGGNAVLDEAASSWNNRLLHETHKVVQNLRVGQDALAMKLEKLGKDDKGATQEWKKIQRVRYVAKMVEAREHEVLAGLEALSGGVDA